MANVPIILYVDNYKGITQQMLKKYVTYDPDAGHFTWNCVPDKTGRMSKRVPGKIAGYKSTTTGYIEIMIEGIRGGAHQLAFLYMTGTVPAKGFEIDHRDTVRDNNKWPNLRVATIFQQRANARVKRNNRIGLKGVSKQANCSTYAASIYRRGQSHYLGSFATADEAHRAYLRKAKELDGDFFHERFVKR